MDLNITIKKKKSNKENSTVSSPQICICKLIVAQVKSDKKLKSDYEFAIRYGFSPSFISRLQNNKVKRLSVENILKFSVLYPTVERGGAERSARLACHLAWTLGCDMSNELYRKIIAEAFSYDVLGEDVYSDKARAEYVYACLNKWGTL